MFLKSTKLVGKPVCVALYAAFAALAAKRKPLPLILLFALHLFETLTVGKKVAKEHGVGALEWIANCLCFGFTWWLPLREGQ